MKTAIGIDVGGTKISMVIGNDRGKILAQRTMPTPQNARVSKGVQDLICNLELLILESGIPKSKILGIGVGIPGAVDSQKGIVPFSPNLEGWKGIPLKKILEQKIKLPTILANDANAAALGEKFFGQGKNICDFIYMTISTGIGGGIVINHKLLEGKSFVAGEVGHTTIVPDGNLCKCGKRGCLEAYASGTAIANAAKRGKVPEKIRKLAKGNPITAQILGPAAKAGDAWALSIYEQAGFYLGLGIANLLNILNPEKIILGGGVLKSAPKIFWQSMIKSCRRDAWPEAMKAVKIVESNLKGHSGDLGALALVFESF